MESDRTAQSFGVDKTPGFETDERELLVGLRAGNDAAFAEMVRRFGGQMLAVARTILRDEEDARDCVQEAFILAVRKIDDFEGRSKLSTWLHRIVVNTSLLHLRSRNRKPEESIDDLQPNYNMMGCRIESPEESYVSLDDLIDKDNLNALVRQVIGQLPENHRIVLLLRDIEEFSVQETADILELTPGAVKTRLHRARSALKVMLGGVLP